MEVLKIITHAIGGDNYVNNATNYLFDERCESRYGYGITPKNAEHAAMQFKQTARFWNNQNKNPLIHAMISYSHDTAPTAETAMSLTNEIIQQLTEEHMALSGVHNEERKGSSYHTHTFISTTNYNDDSMLYPDNKTNYALAQRTADVTGQPVMLVVENDKHDEWECPVIFVPRDDEE